VARQRLHLPLSGRLGEAEVTRAWKRAAAEHHPDRGGLHDTMQLINGARDLLLGRGLT
jgi:DnaJ-class molecular chaperone